MAVVSKADLLTRANQIRQATGGSENSASRVGGLLRDMVDSMMAVAWYSGTGSPEGAVTATVGSLYSRTDGGAGSTLYVKESGSGNTGWVAK